MQSCGCIPSMINYNLCVGERVGKKERTTYNLIKGKSLRKKETITTLSMQGREWDGNLERSNGEREGETNKSEDWLKLEEDLSLLSHYAYVRALLLLYNIT